MTEEIKLVQLVDFPSMDTSSPMPTILADESKVNLLYYLKENINYGNDSNVIVEEITNQHIVNVSFDFYLQYKFGSPNDEALNGHKYYKYGLSPYSFYEVHNSDLIDELERMNRVHPMHSAAAFSKVKHIIISFRDSCFEIVAKKYSIKKYRDHSMKDCLENITKSLYG
jgi:hypothetical protein